MNIFQNQYSILNSVFRSVPLTLPTVIFIYIYFNKNKFISYLFIGTLIINFLCIPPLKKILIPVGNYLAHIYKTDDIPIIGRFKRPIGAINTGCFYISDTNYTTTSGMPSGHCMLISFTCIYIYYFISEYYTFSKNQKFCLFILMLLITIYMAYTRILMNCHTIQQTIIGTVLGIILGHIYFFYIKKNKIK